MQLYNSLNTPPLMRQCALTIGTFDGVHRGHQELIKVLQREAKARNLPVTVLTFHDMPYYYFNTESCPRLLTLKHEKNEVFQSLLIDHLFNVPFDAAIAEQPAEFFVRDILVRRLGLELLVVGPDFALGKGRHGNVPRLQALGQELGFDVVVLEQKVMDGDEPVSSTRIREAVESGDVSAAMRMLGRPFSFTGKVVSGKQLGRTIGVPTINLQLHPRKVIPAHGIYAARAWWGEDKKPHDKKPHRAALSIGSNPTVNGSGLNIEFHVIGEDIETPPETAYLEIIARLRDEQKFADLPTLVAQMQRDIARADEILAAY
ncbi:MAG: riboflavin biosynthesis protein RibF [Abitibacteriaceae bacterium]|nr:riboflavin biosynthesis protein RibF [Abditibacteriaceae bacterium]MBV9865163.1 riboflavin biosynthesis protein RibF [Abditibacteriaceae bacterium]